MISRPKTLKEIANRSDSIEEFGRHLRDWLHELRLASSRIQAEAAVSDEPSSLRTKFPEGAVADAWLAAYAEHLSTRIGHPAPAWAFSPNRVLSDPAFDPFADSQALRAIALKHSPAAFKRRNIYTPAVDLPLRLRAGRPRTSAEGKREKTAERQRRFRARKQQELIALRALLRKATRGKQA